MWPIFDNRNNTLDSTMKNYCSTQMKNTKTRIKPCLSFLWTYTMLAEITLGTFIDQLLTRIVAIFTLRVVFCFLNESKGVWVIVKRINTSKIKIWVFPKNTFGMCRITAMSTIVKTNDLSHVLLYRYHNNIHLSYLQVYNKEWKDSHVVYTSWFVVV